MSMNVPQIPSPCTPGEILAAGLAAAGNQVKLAYSFSVEDTVIIDIIQQSGLPIGVFALDTGRLNEETYEVADAISERYGIPIKWYVPRNRSVEKLGLDRNEKIRKV